MSFIIAICLGFSWGHYQALKRLDWTLPVSSQASLVVMGKVIGLPNEQQFGKRFDLSLTEICQNASCEKIKSTTVRLFWANCHVDFYAGDTLKLKVSLKPPFSLNNPGSFDTEKFLFLNKIRARGSVKALISHQVNTHHFSLLKFRHVLYQKILSALDNKPSKGIIAALVVGDKSFIPASYWQILQKTGTNHLVAISGLHVSMIAMSVFALVSFLWRRSYKAVHVIASFKVGAIFAILAAFVYATLAGWSVPTQRAFIMVTVAMCGFLLHYSFSPWFLYFTALLIVLLVDPLAPLSVGFWLSFLAVGSLILAFSGWWHRENPKLKQWFAPQWVVFIGLLPLSILFFGQTTLIGPLANFIAIPWVSLIVVPLSLLGALLIGISETLGVFFLNLAHISWEGVWFILAKFAQLPFSIWSKGYYSLSAIILALIGSFILLLPKGLPYKNLSVLAFLPLVFNHAPRPNQNELWFNLLSVGQGLSAVIQTQNHVLIYDTGPKFGDNFDAGNRVLVPFLQKQGIQKIDTVIISHSDLDHRGGLASLLNFYPTDSVITPVPHKVPEFEAATKCYAGQKWTWDGVEFSMLSPDIQDVSSKVNNQSCVLKISVGSKSILLTGDIESSIEYKLLKTQKKALSADILVVPHHGSKTSSSDPFIEAVAPEYALYSVGKYNFYRFPHSKVVEKYNNFGAKAGRTDEQGMIEFKLSKDTAELEPPGFYAQKVSKFWHFRSQ